MWALFVIPFNLARHIYALASFREETEETHAAADTPDGVENPAEEFRKNVCKRLVRWRSLLGSNRTRFRLCLALLLDQLLEKVTRKLFKLTVELQGYG